MSNRRGSDEGEDDSEDDDLRSLLSGSEHRPLISNPHRGSGMTQHRQGGSPLGGQEGGHSGGTHPVITDLALLSPGVGEGNSFKMNTNSGNNGGSRAGRSGAESNSSHASSKKVLCILGAVILIMGFLGPSGILWDVLGNDGAGGQRSTKNGAKKQQAMATAVHGDKHHQLSPPPPSADYSDRGYVRHSNGYNTNIGNGAAQHPMMHSSQGVQRATNSNRHEKFGNRNKKRNWESNRKQNSNGGGGNRADRGVIKEAIENIDKVFMDNRPVASENRSGVKKTKKKQAGARNGPRAGEQSRGRGAEGGEDDDQFLNDDATSVLPVVRADDNEELPANADALDAYTYSLPASDALECRASVIAFVINATDVRDECDGLRKAFDKTCSVHGGGGAGAAPAPAVGGAQHQHRQRRRLSERGRPRLWKLIPEAFVRERERLRRTIMDEEDTGRLGRAASWKRRLDEGNPRARAEHPSKLAAKEGLVDDNGSGMVPSSGSSGMRQRRADEQEEYMVQKSPSDGAKEPPPVQQKQKQEQQHVPPMISLNIPTSDKHISEEMLNDALLLQSSDNDAPTQPKAVANSAATGSHDVQQQRDRADGENMPPSSETTQGAMPVGQPQHQQQLKQHQDSVSSPIAAGASSTVKNMTAAPNEAAQDAAESAEAIRTAVEGVKNIMNDPKSVEARTCCASILSVFHEHCDPTTTGVEDYSDRRLLVVVFVITVCGIVKSVIRHLNIRWLPEAGGCILVGVFGYLVLQHMPHVQFAFDGDMFLRIMVPPIVFEAAVKINKQSFRRHVVPITIFAIVGTLASTAFTAFILHKGSSMLGHYVTTIPVRESLIFGALISSIDPIAVLSVLNNMGMNDTETIYVLIFGESLLNDGVAIVLFQTLVHFLDETLVIDSDVVLDAFLHFVVVALGSVTVGMVSGACATIYFALMHGCQTPMVEVIMFCCWSFIPYYICDMVEWSGIVAIVANGFVMDLFVIGQKQQQQNHSATVDDEIDFLVNGTSSSGTGSSKPTRKYRQQQCRTIFSYEGHLSPKADSHVHFVVEIFATLMETAIFAYLGLFLFSPRYHWNGYLSLMSIFATVMGRVIMIPLLSHVGNIFNRMSQSRNRESAGPPNSEGVHIDRRMQIVLIFAGLRGAMSFALVEHIPLYDTTTGQGSRFKPELKAMTSASIIFTVFVLGGGTSYLMERLGYSLNKMQQHDSFEIAPLVHQHDSKRKSPVAVKRAGGAFTAASNEAGLRSNGSVRQRGPR